MFDPFTLVLLNLMRRKLSKAHGAPRGQEVKACKRPEQIYVIFLDK